MILFRASVHVDSVVLLAVLLPTEPSGDVNRIWPDSQLGDPGPNSIRRWESIE